MKTNYSSVLLGCMALFASCAAEKGYVVSGSAEGTEAGDTVYICDMQGFFSLVPTDTAVVKADGSFEFKGECEGASYRFLVPTHKGSAEGLGMADFILENAKIEIHTYLQASGKEPEIKSEGKENALFERYNALMKEWAEKQQPSWDVVREKKGTDEEIAKAQAELDSLTTLANEATKAFIIDNLPSGVSDMLLPQLCAANEAMKDELMAAFAEKYPDGHNYKKMVAEKTAAATTGIGSPYTDFEMADPQGNNIKISDYVGKNKFTLVDFWASWCGPCRGEMPNVVAAYNEYHGKGLEVIGVSLDNSKEAWVKAISELKMPWPQMSDLKGWNCAGAALYNVKAIPSNVLISQDGKIVAKDLREEELHAKLAELFN